MTNAVTLASLANSGYLRNRIINGAMQIDQRNAGAAVTPAGAGYTLDRWKLEISQGSKLTIQQLDTSGFGFKKYLRALVASTATVGSSDYFGLIQYIEGFNCADFEWGTAAAKTVTLSFWAYSTVAGTYGGSLRNSGSTRSYPFSYTLPGSAWTYVTITIPGDTSGTWLTDNGVGVNIYFSLGTGSTYAGTAGAWAEANYATSTGSTSIMGTSSAVFAITGVQFEVGTQATPFEWRPYPLEFQLAQRYYEKDDIPATGSPKISTAGLAQGTTHYVYGFKVTKRTTPTVAMTYIANIDNSTTAIGTTNISSGAFRGFNTISNGSFYYADAWVTYAASAEL